LPFLFCGGTINIYSDDFPDGPVDKIPNFHWRGVELRSNVSLGQKKKRIIEPNKNENRIYQLKKTIKKKIYSEIFQYFIQYP